jgi:hypothetical protein
MNKFLITLTSNGYIIRDTGLMTAMRNDGSFNRSNSNVLFFKTEIEAEKAVDKISRNKKIKELILE